MAFGELNGSDLFGVTIVEGGSKPGEGLLAPDVYLDAGGSSR